MRKVELLLMSIFLLLFSCSKGEEPVAPDPPKIDISIPDISFPDEIGKAESFTLTTNVPWKIALSDTRGVPSWLQVSPLSGQVGTVTVNVTVMEANDSYDDRNAYIRIEAGTASKVFTVTQKKKDALILTQDKIEMDAGGGEFSIRLQTNNSYTVKIPEESATWISRVNGAKTRALETKTEKFEVKGGTDEGRRQGMIVFESADLNDTVYVFQAQKDVLILSENEAYVSNEQSKIEVDVRTNLEYDVLIPSDVTWIKQVMTRVLRVDKLTLSISANESYDGRSAQVVVKDKNSALADTLTVVQSQVNALILGQKKINDLSCCGEQFTVTVKSNVNFTYDISAEAASWLSVVQTRGLKENIIKFSVPVNNEYDREAKVVFGGEGGLQDTLYVKQNGAKTILMEFYYATGGDNWTDKTNWGSNEPLNKWYGIYIGGNQNQVTYLDFMNNNLVGKVSYSLGQFKYLDHLNFSGNPLLENNVSGLIDALSDCSELTFLGVNHLRNYGNVPSSIKNLINLKNMQLGGGITAIAPEIGELSKLEALMIQSTPLTTLPPEIGKLSNLKTLDLYGNNLVSLPEEIGNLSRLESLSALCNKLTTFPKGVFRLTNLKSLSLEENEISGTLPDGNWNAMTNLEYCDLSHNRLVEPFPLSLMQSRIWTDEMERFINQRGYTIYPPLEYACLKNRTLYDSNFTPHKAYDLFAKGSYTIMVSYQDNLCGYDILGEMSSLYEGYKDKGLQVFMCHQNGGLDDMKNSISSANLEKYGNYFSGEDNVPVYDVEYFWASNAIVGLMVVDNKGRLFWNHTENITHISEFIQSLLGEPEKIYESTDFSKDGEVVTLQKATVGTGINLVVLGDGFTDKDMKSDGKYVTRAKEAMEHFFSVEPVKNFRNRFNVYCVKAVSLNEGVGNNQKTAFSVKFGEDTFISGDNDKCIQYAMKVPSITCEDNTVVITVINSSRYAGTCHMFGNNASVSYCPIVGFNEERFAQIIHHEAVGHGFGKLADEYSYTGTIPDDEKNSYITQQQSLGWWSNIDFTSDPNSISWHSFLQNAAYTGQVGIYEGGCTYQYGVWRSTQNSIMLDNTGVFNAPSRQAIYKWIMELSGDSYRIGKFLEYDAINRTAVTRALGTRKVAKDFVPLAPPVVVSKKK